MAPAIFCSRVHFMKAIIMHAFGGPEVLQTGEAPKPVPKDGEILIRVKAAGAGVNPVDLQNPLRQLSPPEDETTGDSRPGCVWNG